MTQLCRILYKDVHMKKCRILLDFWDIKKHAYISFLEFFTTGTVVFNYYQYTLKPWYANTRIYYMARIMVLQEYYWETHRILVETSTERAETQFMLFELY